MNHSDSLRRVTVVVAVAVLGLVLPVSAVQAGNFRASGTDQVVSSHGNQSEGITEGLAMPGGSFNGVWSGTARGYTISGVETWYFGGGHTLTWAFELEFSNKSDITVGTYTMIDGTGRFNGASGTAEYFRVGLGGGMGEWSLEGELDR